MICRLKYAGPQKGIWGNGPESTSVYTLDVHNLAKRYLQPYMSAALVGTKIYRVIMTAIHYAYRQAAYAQNTTPLQPI